MQSRPLGKTGLQIPVLSFGAGPVSTLMVGERNPQQRDVIAYAIERGINWFDTAATYGNGQSEQNLGRVLVELGVDSTVRVASQVRLTDESLSDIRGAVRQSVEGSLKRMQLSRLTLLQLHNSITPQRGDEPTSLTPEDVLGSGGVVEAFEELRQAGLVSHIGLTGIGHPASLAKVVCSNRFETMQVPYHLLNPSAGLDRPEEFSETNYGNIIATCAEMQMGVMAIRVLAGGALAGNPPSPHTFNTQFFPLALYERDRQRANRIREALGPDRHLPQEAIRFALAHSQISSAIVGFGEVSQIDEALAAIHATTPVLNWNDIRSFESSTISH
ncbi:MAG TPA: aldo/keto reductase [Planctomycetaceae bacterium]|nr:aldo/keto reductase [Planctomycetaceae bacterium]